MKKLLDNTFISIDSYLKHAPDIISRLSVHKNKTRIKEAISLCRDYLTNPLHPPILKICTVKFLKDLFDQAIFYIIELIQQNILPIFEKVILYRQEVKSMERGNTYLLSELENEIKGQDIIEIMSRYIIPSQSYFEVIHQCVFYWAKYVEEDKSPFKAVYERVRHCTFPKNFKHFQESEVEEFRNKYHLEMNAVEYELEDCFKKWEETKDKLQEMEKKDFVRENLEGIYNWISSYVTEYTNLLVDLKDSYYYQRKGMKEKMLMLLVEKKEFLKIYIECVGRNSFNKLYEKYGKYEEDIIDEEFGIDKRKKEKKKKVPEPEDRRLTDIKRIYLADYPVVLNKLDSVQVALEKNKGFVEYRYSESRVQNHSRILDRESNGAEEFDIKVGGSIGNNQINNQMIPTLKTETERTPSKRLKSSFVSNGLAVLNSNTPQSNKPTPFVILPSQSQSFQTPSKRIKNSPLVSNKSGTIEQNGGDVKTSLNNVVYRQELLRQQRKVNASLGVLPSKWKQQDYNARSVSKKTIVKPKA